jgi:phage shock protein A
MSLMRRLSMIFKSKASRALDAAEDPRETLDYSYERLVELVQQTRRGVADVATSRKRVELQSQQLEASRQKLERQARQALEHGREDLAREALARRAFVAGQLDDLHAQEEHLRGEEQKLVTTAQRLDAKVQAFRTRKETIKATYTAAEADTKVGEALSGVSEEMSDVGLAMQRAEDKINSMQARSGALDELMSSGALDDLSARSDPIQAELDRTALVSDVDEELSRLKGEIGASDSEALEAGPKDTP